MHKSNSFVILVNSLKEGKIFCDLYFLIKIMRHQYASFLWSLLPAVEFCGTSQVNPFPDS